MTVLTTELVIFFRINNCYWKFVINLFICKGVPDWRLTLCLLGAWIGIFLVMIRGVKSSGKAAYFLALFPYVIMFVLLIR